MHLRLLQSFVLESAVKKVATMAYGINRLYEDCYTMKYDWEQYLEEDIYLFHKLVYEEFNSPVALQMGTLLPFVASLAGPKAKGLWSTRPNVLNFFTINIAASGTGKSQSRKKLVSEPLKYILQNVSNKDKFPDMEVNKFTRAGIEDKLICTGGYCMLITDEGAGFLKDLKNKDCKHESDIVLINQLYDGEGDKVTLAQNKQRVIPPNSTCIAISLQQEAFVNGIFNLGSSLWMDSGFSERFMVTAVKPFRHHLPTNREAYEKMCELFDENFLGKVCLGIYNYHFGRDICYKLSDVASKVYEEIVEKYNEQFNLKWASSQENLDEQDKAEISVRTKAPELIGRLSVILWIYTNAFLCVKNGRKFHIDVEVSAQCVKNADKIIHTSYGHSESFTSAVFSRNSSTTTTVGRPKCSDTSRIVGSIIRSEGCIVNVRNLNKTVKTMSAKAVKDELQFLQDKGYGRLVLREDMMKDNSRQFKNCSTVYMKPAPFYLEKEFLKMANDSDLSSDLYIRQFRKPTEQKYWAIVRKYHPHFEDLTPSQIGELESDEEISDEDGNIRQLPQYVTLDGQVKSSLFRKKTTPVNVPPKPDEDKDRQSSSTDLFDSDRHLSDNVAEEAATNSQPKTQKKSKTQSSKKETQRSQSKKKSQENELVESSSDTSMPRKSKRIEEKNKKTVTSSFTNSQLIEYLNDSFESETSTTKTTKTSKRKVIATTLAKTDENKIDSSRVTLRKLKDCSKLKQTTRVYAKKIDCLLTSGDSDTSTKSTTVKLTKKNTKPDIVIPETTTTDFGMSDVDETQQSTSKRRRRLSLRKRNQQHQSSGSKAEAGQKSSQKAQSK